MEFVNIEEQCPLANYRIITLSFYHPLHVSYIKTLFGGVLDDEFSEGGNIFYSSIKYTAAFL